MAVRGEAAAAAPAAAVAWLDPAGTLRIPVNTSVKCASTAMHRAVPEPGREVEEHMGLAGTAAGLEQSLRGGGAGLASGREGRGREGRGQEVRGQEGRGREGHDLVGRGVQPDPCCSASAPFAGPRLGRRTRCA